MQMLPMSYIDLYRVFAEKELYIRQNDVRESVLSLSGISQVRYLMSQLDISVCRGMYLSPRNMDHQFSKQFGGHIIVIARGLNKCWQRFVFVKELMHMLDGVSEHTDKGDIFERMLFELPAPAQNQNCEQAKSEITAIYKALGVLCPEVFREKFKFQRKSGQITDHYIALQLKIPEIYIPILFSSSHEDFLYSLNVHK